MPSIPETPGADITASFREPSLPISAAMLVSSASTRAGSALASIDTLRLATAKSRDRFETVAICELGMM
jgi:hypothetical protein